MPAGNSLRYGSLRKEAGASFPVLYLPVLASVPWSEGSLSHAGLKAREKQRPQSSSARYLCHGSGTLCPQPSIAASRYPCFMRFSVSTRRLPACRPWQRKCPLQRDFCASTVIAHPGLHHTRTHLPLKAPLCFYLSSPSQLTFKGPLPLFSISCLLTFIPKMVRHPLC